ncbi:uncharacterized protein EV422DRAFT_609391 [Fimicolochytrium jonesii]|uniref:uncharacterized protein n=1 Tax=Fimicolochytrium jonesii TaxID=1396493 RepID=UPI0022FE5078|nr:uncharacterized protein EV422DRAFT_609391 [Fimicolochytrium jonesii]KAI8824303.1 hypothetical protein EV422DRAFT_609391 [Fimicolochytrium jonesii]
MEDFLDTEYKPSQATLAKYQSYNPYSPGGNEADPKWPPYQDTNQRERETNPLAFSDFSTHEHLRNDSDFFDWHNEAPDHDAEPIQEHIIANVAPAVESAFAQRHQSVSVNLFSHGTLPLSTNAEADDDSDLFQSTPSTTRENHRPTGLPKDVITFPMIDFYLRFITHDLTPETPYTHLQAKCVQYMAMSRVAERDLWISRDWNTVHMTSRGFRVLQDLTIMRRVTWAVTRIQEFWRRRNRRVTVRNPPQEDRDVFAPETETRENHLADGQPEIAVEYADSDGGSFGGSFGELENDEETRVTLQRRRTNDFDRSTHFNTVERLPQPTSPLPPTIPTLTRHQRSHHLKRLWQISTSYTSILHAQDAIGFQRNDRGPSEPELKFMDLLNADETYQTSKDVLDMDLNEDEDDDDRYFGDMENKGTVKVYKDYSPQVVRWIRETLSQQEGEDTAAYYHHPSHASTDLITLLRSGDILIRLSTTLFPSTPCHLLTQPSTHTIHKLVFFLELAKLVGVESGDLFSVWDILIDAGLEGRGKGGSGGRAVSCKVLKTVLLFEKCARGMGGKGVELVLEDVGAEEEVVEPEVVENVPGNADITDSDNADRQLQQSVITSNDPPSPTSPTHLQKNHSSDSLYNMYASNRSSTVAIPHPTSALPHDSSSEDDDTTTEASFVTAGEGYTTEDDFKSMRSRLSSDEEDDDNDDSLVAPLDDLKWNLGGGAMGGDLARPDQDHGNGSEGDDDESVMSDESDVTVRGVDARDGAVAEAKTGDAVEVRRTAYGVDSDDHDGHTFEESATTTLPHDDEIPKQDEESTPLLSPTGSIQSDETAVVGDEAPVPAAETTATPSHSIEQEPEHWRSLPPIAPLPPYRTQGLSTPRTSPRDETSHPPTLPPPSTPQPRPHFVSPPRSRAVPDRAMARPVSFVASRGGKGATSVLLELAGEFGYDEIDEEEGDDDKDAQQAHKQQQPEEEAQKPQQQRRSDDPAGTNRNSSVRISQFIDSHHPDPMKRTSTPRLSQFIDADPMKRTNSVRISQFVELPTFPKLPAADGSLPRPDVASNVPPGIHLIPPTPPSKTGDARNTGAERPDGGAYGPGPTPPLSPNRYGGEDMGRAGLRRLEVHVPFVPPPMSPRSPVSPVGAEAGKRGKLPQGQRRPSQEMGKTQQLPQHLRQLPQRDQEQRERHVLQPQHMHQPPREPQQDLQQRERHMQQPQHSHKSPREPQQDLQQREQHMQQHQHPHQPSQQPHQDRQQPPQQQPQHPQQPRKLSNPPPRLEIPGSNKPNPAPSTNRETVPPPSPSHVVNRYSLTPLPPVTVPFAQTSASRSPAPTAALPSPPPVDVRQRKGSVTGRGESGEVGGRRGNAQGKKREAGVAKMLLSESNFVYDLTLAAEFLEYLTHTTPTPTPLTSHYTRVHAVVLDMLAIHRALLDALRHAALSSSPTQSTSPKQNTNALGQAVLRFATAAIPVYSSYAVAMRDQQLAFDTGNVALPPAVMQNFLGIVKGFKGLPAQWIDGLTSVPGTDGDGEEAWARACKKVFAIPVIRLGHLARMMREIAPVPVPAAVQSGGAPTPRQSLGASIPPEVLAALKLQGCARAIEAAAGKAAGVSG